MDPRKIIHVDMDAFFASVEQRDAPELRGQPVAVGGSSGRGVVAAASYEARRFGVRSAMPSLTAKRLCPDLIFVRPRFEVYREVSRQIRAIFADYTDLIEPLSLDEAYLDVTANRRGLPSATSTAEEIRARIRAETGLTASAGISYNKLLAKLASDMNKPDGQCVITPARGPAVVAALEVGRFHGIGPKTAAKLNGLGIFTGADLRAQDVAFLDPINFAPTNVTLKAYTLVNLDAEYKLSGKVTLFGRVENLFDADYEEVFSYASPGVAAYAGVRVGF